MGPVSAQSPQSSPTAPAYIPSRVGHSVRSAPVAWQDATRNQHGYFPDPTYASRDAWQGQASMSTSFSSGQHYAQQSMQPMAMYRDVDYPQAYAASPPYDQGIPGHVGSPQQYVGQALAGSSQQGYSGNPSYAAYGQLSPGVPGGNVQYDYASAGNYQGGHQMQLPAAQR